MKLAQSQRASLLRNRDNFLRASERPRHHSCLGKRYSRAACKGTSLSLKRCHRACNLRQDAKAEFIAASWEAQEAKAEARKAFNEGRAIEEALAPKKGPVSLEEGHPLRRRSLKLVEKARQLAEVQRNKLHLQEEGSPAKETEKEAQAEEVVLSRA